MLRHLAVPLIAAVLVVPDSASAKSPPKGIYDCTIGGTLFGSIHITGAGGYKRFNKKGTYTAKGTRTRAGGVRAFRISFRTGPLKGFSGDWHKTSDGINEIALRNPRDGFESIYCDSRRR